MQVEIISKPFHLSIYGFSGKAINKNYIAKIFQLSDKMWQTVKRSALKNKGKNIWIYENDDNVFAGVELETQSTADLEHKDVSLNKYAYYKHVGPYNLIGQSGERMKKELAQKGIITCLPYIEIYGHWTSDETKLETELIMCLHENVLAE